MENIDKSIFKKSEFENVSFKFISSLQLELMKFLSRKLINDQYEDSYYVIKKLNHNENVNAETLAKICNALDCNFDDIMEIVKD